MNGRGKKASKRVGRHLKKRGVKIDKIVSSGAKRAYETAKRVAKELNISKSCIDVRDELYDCDVKEILKVIKSIDDQYKSVLIISHNPTITDLAYDFTKDVRFNWLPTAGVVGLKFNTKSFKKITKGTKTEINLFITPKMLER